MMQAALMVGWMWLIGVGWAEEPPPVSPPIVSVSQRSPDAAIIIGNEAYEALPQAVYANRDAQSVTEWLQKSRGISRYRTTQLESASRSEMAAAVRRTARRVQRRGTLWIYYSGHGVVSSESGERGLLGVEAQPANLDAAMLSLADIVDSARSARRAWRIVLIVDAGFGEMGRDGLPMVVGREVPAVGDVPDFGSGVNVWLADVGAAAAETYPQAQHGLFTYLVLGATRGWADGVLHDPMDEQVSLLEAQTYVDQMAQRLGRVTQPSIELRADENRWLLAEGSALEMGPDWDVSRQLSLSDRQGRFDQKEALLQAEAAAFWADTMLMVQAGGPEGRTALEGFIAEYERANIAVNWAVALPEVARAREILATYDETATQSVTMAANEIVATCDDLIALEQDAMIGGFSFGQTECLENRLRTERLQTTRAKVSRLLLVNAQSAGDVATWETLMARHLEEIDRSDPDLCFLFAVHLYRSGGEGLEESLRWADYALANKHVWEGEQFIRKVSNLYKLRAEAAAKLWQAAEEMHSQQPDGESDAMAREYRGTAMDYAREWLDYTRAADLSGDRAYEMCVSASGTEEFCKAD